MVARVIRELARKPLGLFQRCDQLVTDHGQRHASQCTHHPWL